MSEFDGLRAEMYHQAMRDYPDARLEDLEVMKRYLDPKEGENILEVGAGSGFFSAHIADAICPGQLIVADPSMDQLDEAIRCAGDRDNFTIICEDAHYLEVPLSMEYPGQVDAIWSFGAMHHEREKLGSFLKFNHLLKEGGRLVVADVFEGSALQRHFDEVVAKYCSTGHDVNFLDERGARFCCSYAYLEDVEFHKADLRWHFENEEDIGVFLYNLHAMTKTTPEHCLESAENILGIEERGGKYFLNWPMTVMTTKKLRGAPYGP